MQLPCVLAVMLVVGLRNVLVKPTIQRVCLLNTAD